MIEPNAHYELYDSRGREPGQDEQDWLRAEQDEQDWLRAEQVLFGLSAALPGSISSFDPLNRNSL